MLLRDGGSVSIRFGLNAHSTAEDGFEKIDKIVN